MFGISAKVCRVYKSVVFYESHYDDLGILMLENLHPLFHPDTPVTGGDGTYPLFRMALGIILFFQNRSSKMHPNVGELKETPSGL